MRKVLKWLGILLGAAVLLLVIAYGVIHFSSNASFNKVYAVDPAPVAIPAPDSAVLAQGAHLAVTRGCAECHGANFGGQVFVDEPNLATLYAVNLTPGEGGAGARYNDLDWVRAIRHGIAPGGRPLLYMPSQEFYHLSDGDLGALVAYLKQVAPVDNVQPAQSVGPLGRALFVGGQLPLVPAELIDHVAARPEAPMPGLTVEYGRYLAVGCIGCHGEEYVGGPIPGVPPEWPLAANLTPDETGLGAWSEADFFTVMRTGKRPDGREINPIYMPWTALGQMTDDEIRAIWLFLQSLPPRKAEA